MQINLKRFTDADVEGGPSTGLAGLFHVELVDAASGIIKQQFSFPNVITNSGLTGMFQTGALLDTLFSLTTGMVVGTGSTVPAVTDTALVAQVGGINFVNGGINNTYPTNLTSPEWFGFRTTREFGFSLGNGNLTEVGMVSDQVGNTMWCRALFKDAGGTPITVTKTVADILRVTYEFRLYPGLGDSVQSSVAISGTNYAITWRPITNQLWPVNLWFSGFQGQGSGRSLTLGDRATLFPRLDTSFGMTEMLPTDFTGWSYNSTTRLQTRRAVFPPSLGAFTGNSLLVSALQSTERCQYQGLVTPAIAKTALNQLVMNYTMQFERVVP